MLALKLHNLFNPECLEEHIVMEGAKSNSPFTEGPLPTSIRNMSSTRSKQAWLTTVYKLTKVKSTVKALSSFLVLVLCFLANKGTPASPVTCGRGRKGRAERFGKSSSWFLIAVKKRGQLVLNPFVLFQWTRQSTAYSEEQKGKTRLLMNQPYSVIYTVTTPNKLQNPNASFIAFLQSMPWI